MALKREQQQVDYATKISVNRGTGFNSLANAYKSRANTFENLTDSFAKVMLNEIQTRGKKLVRMQLRMLNSLQITMAH